MCCVHIDIDECVVKEMPCGNKSDCVNIEGDYMCLCKDDGRSESIDNCTSGN